MKVIHLISGGDTGGAKTHLHYLLSGICQNIEATLVCFMEGDFSREAREKGIPTIVLEGDIGATRKKLISMVCEGKYDIIHSHGARGNFMARLIHKASGLPWVITVHSNPKLDYMGRRLAGLIYGNLNKNAMNCSDYLIGVSDSMKDFLIDENYEPNDIFTIYNGVDFEIKPQNADRISYFKDFGLDLKGDEVVVGIAARLDLVKDMASLIRGFALAYKENNKLRLAIAGDGAEMENLKNLAKELGVFEKVCFLGWISDVNSFYAALDINTLTSISETFPYSITEGARATLPTVSSRVGGVPKLVISGETGFLFEPRDFESLGKYLLQLSLDENLRRDLGQKLYNKAKSEFSVEATTRRQIEIYSEILRREALKKEHKRDGVVICGAYGMGNAGDDAILEAIVSKMREINEFMPIYALTRMPLETKKRYKINTIHTFNLVKLKKVAKKTKLYLSGGGSLMQNVTSRRSLWYYLETMKIAKKQGNSVMMYGSGIGPIVDRRDEMKMARVLNENVDVISLREAHSMGELKEFGVNKPQILVASDPALSIAMASEMEINDLFLKNGLDFKENYVCFALRNWKGFNEKAESFAKAADFANEVLGLIPVFFLINPNEDMAATQMVREKMKAKSHLVEPFSSSALTIGFMSKMKLVCSMRLHALIFAAAGGASLVGVSYDPKVTAFMDNIDKNCCIDLKDMTEEKLIKLLETGKIRSEDKEGQKAILAKLIAQEKENGTHAKKLLEE